MTVHVGNYYSITPTKSMVYSGKTICMVKSLLAKEVGVSDATPFISFLLGIKTTNTHVKRSTNQKQATSR